MARNNDKNLTSLPKPVRLDAPKTSPVAPKSKSAPRNISPRPGSSRRKSGARRQRRRVNPAFTRAISIGAVGVATFIVVGLLLLNLFSHNALAVYMDEVRMGHVTINRDWEPDHVHYRAVAHLESRRGTTVIVDQRVTTRPTRAGRRNIMSLSEMSSLLSDNFTYKISATAIHVNDSLEAVVRTEACALNAAQMLKAPFITENTVVAEFVEDWQLVPWLIDEENEDVELLTPLDAAERLERPAVSRIEYVVQGGDTLGALAMRFNTPMDRIALINDITTSTIIRPGDTLYIETRRPLLSVRTIDEVLVSEEIPMPIEVIYNPDIPESQRVVIHEGQPGEQLIARRITKVDGVQVSYEVSQHQIVRDAVTHVIEEGTGQPVVERR